MSSEDYDGAGSCFSCHTATLARARELEAPTEVTNELPPGPTTWAPQPLDEILEGDYVPPTPTMLARSDGPCLVYAGKSHWIQAEPEALKSWLGLHACAGEMRAGFAVIYIDFEDSAPTVIGRLLALGVERTVIRELFIYIRPDEPLVAAALADLNGALEANPTLVVIDGVTEAFSRQGLSPLDNGDIALWLDLFPRRFARAAAATLSLDHVVKDKEQRGRYAIGGQHKLAGVDVAYSMRVVQPFGRGREGIVTIKVEKDRPGGVREHANGEHVVATLRATSHDDGRVSLSLEPPENASDVSWGFRPTLVMDRVSRFVEGAPSASQADIEANVQGRSAVVRKAIQVLVDEEYLRREREGAAWRHVSVQPFRNPDETPNPSTRPDSSQLVPDEVPDVLVHSSRPFKGEDEDGTRTTTLQVATRPGESFEEWEARIEAELGARRVEAVELLLRSIIRDGQERPYVAVGQAADDLRRLAKDLMPESQWPA